MYIPTDAIAALERGITHVSLQIRKDYVPPPIYGSLSLYLDQVHDLDSIDIGILRDLQSNCRTTYQVMSQKYGVTANAIRNRVERLRENDFITDFVIFLSPAMADINRFFALAYSNRSLDNEEFINKVGNHRLVNRVGFDSYGACVISGTYRLPEDLSEFSEFIHGLDGVRDCEIHPIPIDQGCTTKLTTLDLKVIKSLRDDPRKPIAIVAKESGLTSRRTRSILNRLIGGNIIRLTIRINPNAGDTIWVTFRIRWDPKVTSGAYIRDILQNTFPNQYFEDAQSATEPVMWISFLVERVSDSEIITHTMKSISSLRVENTILPFAGKFFPSLNDAVLDSLLKDVGLL